MEDSTIQIEKTIPSEFTISAMRLSMLHADFQRKLADKKIFYSDEENRIRKCTIELDFNAFKIYFFDELVALGLSVNLD